MTLIFMAAFCCNSPPPPGASKDPLVRYLDVRENDPPDDARLARWIRQAAKLPGWGKN